MIFLYIFCFESQERVFSRFSVFSVLCSISAIFSCFPYRENLPLYCIPLNHLLLVFSSAIGLYVTPQNALWIGAKKIGSTWTWTDGSLWNPFWNYWGETTLPDFPGVVFQQPNGYGVCAHMYTYRTTPNGGWNDLYYDIGIYRTYYVFEIDSR